MVLSKEEVSLMPLLSAGAQGGGSGRIEVPSEALIRARPTCLTWPQTRLAA